MHDLRGIQIARIPGKPAVSDVCVVILKAQPELRINIASGPAKIFVGRYGHAFFANGPAITGFRLSERILNTQYEFTTFRLGALIALTRPDAPSGMLTALCVRPEAPETMTEADGTGLPS